MSDDTLVLPLRWKNAMLDGCDLYVGAFRVGYVSVTSSGTWLAGADKRFLAPYLSRHATMDEAKAALIAAVKELANG